MKTAAATLACVALLALCTPATHAATGPRIAPRQELVALLAGHPVTETPDPAGKALAFIDPTRPITGQPTVLPVLAQNTDQRGLSWLQVRLPGRTLTSTGPPRVGWISAVDTLGSTT
ncbi:MAG: hypothetical protein LC749_03250, partial [Actinobacteria bacterium]|nr:hypothetical protein [Actinomycetota bacterium]